MLRISKNEYVHKKRNEGISDENKNKEPIHSCRTYNVTRNEKMNMSDVH